MKRKVEIMSPAGSYESLMAAVRAGADSVYFGVEQLNMRARSSSNFTLDDLEKIAEICSKHGLHSYIALNTVMYDHDLHLMRSIVDKAKESGITAIIASDHAVLNYARKACVKLHISTQANISNIETVAFYAAYADVIVLARELSLLQVEAICSEIESRQIKGPSGKLVRIELFAHGALCMAISGKCYLSLHSHLASANRGACVQNCRRQYIVRDREEGMELAIDNEYIMSAKDLCTIGFLDKILDAGVAVLKIEGRGRSADYVYTATRCYRQAADAVVSGEFTPDKIENWKEQLSSVFNRGFWDGYYLGRKMGEWSDAYGSLATKKKIYVGRGVKYFGKIKVGEFLLESNRLKVGDEVYITGPGTGFLQTKVEELRVNDRQVEEAVKGDVFSMPVPEKIRPSDKLYKVVKSSCHQKMRDVEKC